MQKLCKNYAKITQKKIYKKVIYKMPLYNCHKCDKTFDRKSSYNHHLYKRKFACDTGIKIDPSKPPQFTSTKKRVPQKPSKKFKCDFCNKYYTRYDNLTRHLKGNCKGMQIKENKMKEIYEMLLQQKKEMDDLKEENKDLKDKMKNIVEKNKEKNITMTIRNNTNSNNENSNNTITNNNLINIVALGEEKMSFSDDAVKYLLNQGFKAIETTVKNTNFSKKRPEFHNVYLPNIRGGYAMVYDGKKWGLKDLKTVLSGLYNDKKDYLEDKFEDLIDSLERSTIKRFQRFLKDDKSNSKCSKEIIKNLKLLMHNEKETIMETIRHNENKPEELD